MRLAKPAATGMVLAAEVSVEPSSRADDAGLPGKATGTLDAQAEFNRPRVVSAVAVPVTVPIGMASVGATVVSVGLDVYIVQLPGLKEAKLPGNWRLGLNAFPQLYDVETF